MKLQFRVVLISISSVLLLTSCCGPIQGTADFGSSYSCNTYSGGCGSCADACSGASNTHSFCGDTCNPGGCSSYFGNVGGLNYNEQGSS